MNDERLTLAEGDELQDLMERFYAGASLTEDERGRLMRLRDRCLLYGSAGVEAKPFVGLEPRYTTSPGYPFKS